MRIITCASYYGTGSSAVTDLLSEFNGCSSVGNHEFRFIHDPDGIRDLAYNLLDNNNRHNTSNAIKRYIRLAKQFNGGLFRKGYKRFMGNAFELYTKEYINHIVELQCESWWYYDRVEKGKVFYLLDSVMGKFGDKVFNTEGFSLLNILHEKAYFSAISREEFNKYTKEYIEKVVNSMNLLQTELIMVDQLLPPSNLHEYLNYFNDIKVVVVERDPRDIFLLEKNEWKGHVVPHTNVQDFCKWFRITRQHRKTEVYDSDKVYFLQFEDLVYKYDETVTKLIEFVGMNSDMHVYPKKYFDPALSISNTNLKERYLKDRKEVECIQAELEEYLYNFPNL